MTHRQPDPLSRFPLVFALVAFACIAPVALNTGCQSLYTGVVSLTRVVQDASREYAKIYNAGLVPPDVASKASVAHAEYRKAAGLLADDLDAVKLGKTADTKAALEAARVAANHFVDVIFGLLPKQRATELRAQIAKAGGL